MRRPQNTWRGFIERVVEPVVLAESALSLPCLSFLPRCESMGLAVLAVLLCFCVPSLGIPSGTCGRDPAMHSGASLWLYSVYHQPERLENGG